MRCFGQPTLEVVYIYIYSFYTYERPDIFPDLYFSIENSHPYFILYLYRFMSQIPSRIDIEKKKLTHIGFLNLCVNVLRRLNLNLEVIFK